MTATTGVLGQRWRADVTPAGVIEPWDGAPPLAWYVAADDRWHDPAEAAAARHGSVAGTAVWETKVRIPGGDAVHRVWSVPDGGGFTVVEVHNDSVLPIAVAFTRDDLATSRPPADVPIEGIDLPPGSIVLPVAHRTAVTVGLPHRAASEPPVLPARLPSAEEVARGWITRTDRASRLDLPEPRHVEAVRAARCELLLAGPPDAGADPAGYLLAVGELVRLGELDARSAAAAAPDVAAAVAAVAGERSGLAAAALDAAGVVLAAAGERRALGDLAVIPRSPGAIGADGIAAIAAVERLVAAGPVLFPGGISPAWRGVGFEAHGLVAGPGARLSLAVRWHGANAAVLWEVTGDTVRLTAPVLAPGWWTDAPRGETLWVAL